MPMQSFCKMLLQLNRSSNFAISLSVDQLLFKRAAIARSFGDVECKGIGKFRVQSVFIRLLHWHCRRI